MPDALTFNTNGFNAQVVPFNCDYVEKPVTFIALPDSAQWWGKECYFDLIEFNRPVTIDWGDGSPLETYEPGVLYDYWNVGNGIAHTYATDDVRTVTVSDARSIKKLTVWYNISWAEGTIGKLTGATYLDLGYLGLYNMPSPVSLDEWQYLSRLEELILWVCSDDIETDADTFSNSTLPSLKHITLKLYSRSLLHFKLSNFTSSGALESCDIYSEYDCPNVIINQGDLTGVPALTTLGLTYYDDSYGGELCPWVVGPGEIKNSQIHSLMLGGTLPTVSFEPGDLAGHNMKKIQLDWGPFEIGAEDLASDQLGYLRAIACPSMEIDLDSLAGKPIWLLYVSNSPGVAFTDYSVISTLTELLYLSLENGLNQAQVDAVLQNVYAIGLDHHPNYENKEGFTRCAIYLRGTNAAPSGLHRAMCPPVTGKEHAYQLRYDSCGRGHIKWPTVSFKA